MLVLFPFFSFRFAAFPVHQHCDSNDPNISKKTSDGGGVLEGSTPLQAVGSSWFELPSCDALVASVVPPPVLTLSPEESHA
jgi:hypothetical protein